MSGCPNTDALITIGAALDWDVIRGLGHLQRCEGCRSRLETLRAAHSALVDSDPVDAVTIARISASLREEAERQRGTARVARRWASALEVLLAGLAGPILLVSGGVEIGSVAAGALTFALAAALVVGGRRIRLLAA